MRARYVTGLTQDGFAYVDEPAHGVVLGKRGRGRNPSGNPVGRRRTSIAFAINPSQLPEVADPNVESPA